AFLTSRGRRNAPHLSTTVTLDSFPDAVGWFPLGFLACRSPHLLLRNSHTRQVPHPTTTATEACATRAREGLQLSVRQIGDSMLLIIIILVLLILGSGYGGYRMGPGWGYYGGGGLGLILLIVLIILLLRGGF